MPAGKNTIITNIITDMSVLANTPSALTTTSMTTITNHSHEHGHMLMLMLMLMLTTITTTLGIHGDVVLLLPMAVLHVELAESRD